VSLLPIHVLGDPILREETRPVTAFNHALRTLVDDMFETMYAAGGIGLAAPQVGRRERLAVMDVEGQKFVLVNPEIIEATGKAKAEEACLSIPEIYGVVERATHVVVRAQNAAGEPYEFDATELLARCCQHEIDHLHGRLFIDYLSYLKRRAALAEWEELRKEYPDNVRHLTTEVRRAPDSDHPEPEM
jgi:peptide deformylase